MADIISTKLYMHACFLRDRLSNGSPMQISEARDRLRNVMLSQHGTGFWSDKPEQLRNYTELLYRCDVILLTEGQRQGTAA